MDWRRCFFGVLRRFDLPGKQLQQLLRLLVLFTHEPLKNLERLCLMGIKRLQRRLQYL